MNAATGSERWLDDMPKPAAGVMRMSADDDDHAGRSATRTIADPQPISRITGVE